MGRRFLLRGVGLLVVVVAAVGASAVAAAQEPIGPHERFVGLVNGAEPTAVVYTVCVGPVQPGETGPVAGDQDMAVHRTSAGAGNTGLFSQVYAWFVPAPGGAAPTELIFTDYGQRQAIPTSIQVPCSGTGQVEFSSCPYLAPCAAGWVPVDVTVTFEDIAV
jgi:hypothetical protein